MDVFRFLRYIAKTGGGLQKAIKDRGGISKIRCLAARAEPQVGIDISFAGTPTTEAIWRYALGIKHDTGRKRQAIIDYEKVWKDKQLILNRPVKADYEDELRLTETHLEQINANAKFREIADYFKSIYYTHLTPQLLRHPDYFIITPNYTDDPFGRTFLERVAQTTPGIRKRRLGKIENALQLAVPQLRELKFTKDANGIPHLEAIYSHWRAKGAKQTEEEFSDGTLRLIGLLWSLLESDSLLLIEEPEISLHASLVHQLPSLIWRLQRKRTRQVIVSTHSSDLLSDKGIGGEEALMLIPNVEGTQVKVAANVEDVKLLLEGGLTVGEALIPKTEPKQINQLSLFE